MLDFPSSPTNGQVYTSGTRSWIYNSTLVAWEGGAAAISPSTLGLGTAATTAATDYATSAQGALAGTAVQPTALLSVDAGNVLTGQIKFWAGSQEDYDAIMVPNPSTVYRIIE